MIGAGRGKVPENPRCSFPPGGPDPWFVADLLHLFPKRFIRLETPLNNKKTTLRGSYYITRILYYPDSRTGRRGDGKCIKFRDGLGPGGALGPGARAPWPGSPGPRAFRAQSIAPQTKISEVFQVVFLKDDPPHRKIMKKRVFGHSLKPRALGTFPVFKSAKFYSG